MSLFDLLTFVIMATLYAKTSRDQSAFTTRNYIMFAIHGRQSNFMLVAGFNSVIRRFNINKRFMYQSRLV